MTRAMKNLTQTSILMTRATTVHNMKDDTLIELSIKVKLSFKLPESKNTKCLSEEESKEDSLFRFFVVVQFVITTERKQIIFVSSSLG